MKRTKLYTEDEKRGIIEEYLTTDISSRVLGKKYGISASIITIWTKQNNETLTMVKSNLMKIKTEQGDIESKGQKSLILEMKRLKKELEDSRLEVSFLKEVVRVVEEDFGLKIKKKPSTEQYHK